METQVRKLIFTGIATCYDNNSTIADTDPAPDQIALLAQETYSTDLIQHLIISLPRLDFGLRKDVTAVCNTLIQRQIGQRFPTVEYLSSREKVCYLLIKG